MNPIMPAPRAEQSVTAIMHEYLGIAQRSKWLILGCIVVSSCWHGVIVLSRRSIIGRKHCLLSRSRSYLRVSCKSGERR